VIRACRDLGIETVAVYSEADRGAAHVEAADEAVCVGPPEVAESYLNIPNIIAAAMITGADAIHPGYGFLSENADFAEICEECSVVFVGPRPSTINQMGDKARARDIMRACGVPVLPGSAGCIESVEEGRRLAAEVGFPVLLKASAGGGGRGMRIVRDEGGFVSAYESAQREAINAFGDGSVYVERFVERPKHVEVQVFGDGAGKVVHLGERDCSIQRRHQKLIEESPGPSLDAATRQALCQAAVLGAESCEYRGAGTVEFLLDTETSGFYFMEMNTRLQVEHCVTEMVARTDLVVAQLRLAAGDGGALPVERPNQGAAIEFRLNAEDPDDGFRPSPGRITELRFPQGPWVRVDSFVREGDEISPYYDSMIAKIIVWGENREECIRRARRALDETHVAGVKTTRSFHRDVLSNARFVEGRYDTKFVAEEYGLE
jgi:acetyl-CoA carboxylase biotin carboxylase subunit